jgi:ectoine hydroxylase-related dioxygenase (phytanoyl-CoA dioxygenase family)
MNYANYSSQLATDGFCIISHVFSGQETAAIAATVDHATTNAATYRKTEDLFAIRQFLKTVPQAMPLVFNDRLKEVISRLFGAGYFVVKSIYFDKPPASNWFVARHQDLTIAVDRKIALDHYGPWTVKQDQYAVQPPLALLEDNVTMRIHLDDTDAHNGALKVIPGSHAKRIYRAANTELSMEEELTCAVPQGGIMIMKPLLVHASGRSTNGRRRRVVHIEFSRQQLPGGLQWAERAYWS